MQKCENIVDLEKPEKMSIWLQNFVSIQPRTSLEKSDVSWPTAVDRGDTGESVELRWRGRWRLRLVLLRVLGVLVRRNSLALRCSLLDSEADRGWAGACCLEDLHPCVVDLLRKLCCV